MSFITADIVESQKGQAFLTNGYPSRPNRILEYLAGPCDGGNATVSSGTYKFPLVTAALGGTTAYQLITGSNIYYCPPPGTKKVTYKYTFSSYSVTTHDINDYKFFIGADEVIKARHNRSGQYLENRYEFNWDIIIGEGNDPTTGRMLTWTTPKMLCMMFRIYGTSNYSNIHGTRYWDGAGGNQFNIPTLSIIATT
jgi:hypothetical protein